MESTATKQNNFNIELYDIKNEDCLKFTFNGKFSEEQAISGSTEWRTLFQNTGEDKSILVWDCKDMTGFDSNARSIWLKAIKDDKMDWHHVSNLKFWQEPIARAYGVRSIPATFLLDENGIIIAKNLRGAGLESKVASLLGGQ